MEPNEQAISPVPEKKGSAKIMFLVFGFVFLALLIGAGVGVMYFLQNDEKDPVVQADEIDETKAWAALSQAKLQKESASQTRTVGQEESASLDLANFPGIDVNSLYTSISRYEGGPQLNSCSSASLYGLENATSESRTYFGEDSNYNKYVITDEEEGIIIYNLSTEGKHFEYFGGDYAVNLRYPTESIFPSAEIEESLESAEPVEEEEDVLGDSDEAPPVNPEDLDIPDNTTVTSDDSNDEVTDRSEPIDAADAFGPDAMFEGSEIIGETTYAILSWSWEQPCEQLGRNEEIAEADLSKIYSRVWIAPDGYNLFREELYLGSITPENLITTITYDISTEVIDFEEVSEYFLFDLDTEVLDIDLSLTQYGSAGYYAAIRDMLETTGVKVLMTEGEYTLSDFYSDKLNLPDSSAHFSDRDFFADGPTGDLLFELYQYERYESISQLTLSFFRDAGDYSYIDYELFYEKVEDDDILSDFEFYDPPKSEEIALKIDGEEVPVTLYDVTFGEETRSSEGSEGIDAEDEADTTEDEVLGNNDEIDGELEEGDGVPVEFDENELGTPFNSFLALAKVNGYKYLFSFGGAIDADAISKINFTTFDSAVGFELETIMVRVKAAGDANTISDGEDTGHGTPTPIIPEEDPDKPEEK